MGRRPNRLIRTAAAEAPTLAAHRCRRCGHHRARLSGTRLCRRCLGVVLDRAA